MTRPRYRTLAALLALFAFGVFLTQGLLASTCSPDGDMLHGDHAGHADAAVSPGHGHDHQGDDRSERPAPPCPFVMPGVGGSCVTASLPGSAGVRLADFAECALARVSPLGAGELILADDLFHPPRT